MDRKRFEQLLLEARDKLAASKSVSGVAKLDAIKATIAEHKPVDISLEKAGLPDAVIETVEGKEAAIEFLQDHAENNTESSNGRTSDFESENVGSIPTSVTSSKIYGVARDDITLNEKQQRFHDTVVNGTDVVEIGAAGTGKTTSVRKTSRSLIDIENRLQKLTVSTKWLAIGTPGVVVVSYTRKAVSNIRHAVVEDLKKNVITLHKLLEFEPVFYEIEDPQNPGQFKKTMRFEPARTASNPLPVELSLVIFEESSMIAVDLYNLLQDAMPHKHQEVFLGDIQQLPPIFGLAILGFKMLELEVIELTEVYRQALESPIISLAWKIINGNPYDFHYKTEEYTIQHPETGATVKRKRVPKLEAFCREDEHGFLKIQPWQKKLSPDMALNVSVRQFNVWGDQGYYNPEEDIILCPFNKAFGTIEINKGLAQHLGVKRGAIVHEVIAGFNKHYLASGDRVLYDKEDAFIVSVVKNGEYLGKGFQPSSVSLDRWGFMREKLTDAEQQIAEEDVEMSEDVLEKLMQASLDQSEDRVNASSHVVTLRMAYGDEEVVLNTANEINNLLGGYALTIHKSQGSEWEKGFILLHWSHAMMISRELLYTATTRFKKYLHVICEVDSFYNGVKSQRIKGDTLKQKAEFFKGKQQEPGSKYGKKTA